MGQADRPAIAAAIVVADRRVLMVRRRVKEGRLSWQAPKEDRLLWQFPAGEVKPGETGEHAAVRETLEETGLTVRPTRTLGTRVHPNTGRIMIYVACEVVDGAAHVADADELDAVEWCDRAKLAEYVPGGLFGPVQEHIDATVA